ncbi:MAG: citrate synthase [Lachnospiraceae bacterium]|jgi:citrate synthase|uniref:citrate synthase n=1 Tax=Clostridium sp. (strain SY8519) TaxID=1042156 RepID=UPI0002171BBB|nr:citrate synthase [Clostridium sp. SY8519]MCI1654806.1 citrate synthase [Lachnospiraceae bacterium]MCI1657137.1 citrate synthase [Lachnospiraceae bacterium]MCI2195646.1 citrate synthase [Lachnospiraceae bacterium]BAK46474.1 citrate synthase [Clostridium sp. SY8519]HAD20411.1 citrate synthase [Lachnospiraceae bacterium]
MNNWNNDSEYISQLSEISRANDRIAPVLFEEYGVNLGLRDDRGKGILTGLTSISKIVSFKEVDGRSIPCDGQLWYRGYRIESLLKNLGPQELGYEKIAALLLTGEMMSGRQLEEFREYLGGKRQLPSHFVRDVLMKAPSDDLMNNMMKGILSLASYDDRAKDTSVPNAMRQCIQLVAEFPLLAAYAYHAYNYYRNGDSLYIHFPDPELSTAENLLLLLRPDQKYTPLEAKVLDTALILHMEHGGGNNSTFTTRVVTSSGSDTYSTIAAAMASLKGPKHGGANIKVMEMMSDIRSHVSRFDDKEEVAAYLNRILDGDAFDGKGLVYGIGHAVYTLSDPRERVFKSYVEQLVEEKGRQEDFALYQNIEELAPELLAKKRKLPKKVCPNVDFYSGFVYDMLGIPQELYTAIFAIARIVGWSAHRLEELICTDKIIRPAYMSVMTEKE